MGDQSRPPVTGYPAAQPTNNTNGYATAAQYAAYPYRPNPYYAQQNPYPYEYADQRPTFLRRMFAFIVAAVVITGAVFFIVWLILRPHVPDFSVDSLTLTNFNISQNSLLSGNWDVKFGIRNPNKKISLSYDDIEADIYYKSFPLSETMIRPFRQGTRNETTAEASFAASSRYVEKWAVDGINSERSSGNVEFNVRVLARVGLNAGIWKARRRVLAVYCGGLSVGISSSSPTGSLTRGSKQCRVVL